MRPKNIKKIRGKNAVDTSYELNVGFLIYYAYHIPLHIDEAGWWFNYTNKSWQNRFRVFAKNR